MDGNEQAALDRENAERAMRRAREVYAKAEDALADPDLSAPVRMALGTAKNFASLACMEFGAGAWAGCLATAGFARESWKEAQRLILLPYAQSRLRQSEKAREGHAKAHGTPEEIEERYRTYARQFWALVERGKPKEKAYATVARFHGISDGPVRKAVRLDKSA